MNQALLDTLFGGGGVGVGAAVVAFLKKSLVAIFKDMIATAIADLKADFTELKVNFAKETGGNSNGLRQKLNEVAEDVAHLKGKVGE